MHTSLNLLPPIKSAPTTIHSYNILFALNFVLSPQLPEVENGPGQKLKKLSLVNWAQNREHLGKMSWFKQKKLKSNRDFLEIWVKQDLGKNSEIQR